jgi:hypothetical protein
MTPRLVCPSCQCAASRRYCRKPQIRTIICLVPHHAEGRFAIVTDVGSGMRWTRYVTRRRTYRVRRSRMVLAPRRWRQVGDDASHHADDGGKRARSPGRLRISRKTIAQGMPAAPAEPVVLPRAFLLHADHGCSPHPAFPAPSHKFEGGSEAKLGPHAPRERRRTSARMVLVLPLPASGARERSAVRAAKTVFIHPLPVLTGRGWGEGFSPRAQFAESPLTPPSQSELCSSRPRKRGEGAHHRPRGT